MTRPAELGSARKPAADAGWLQAAPGPAGLPVDLQDLLAEVRAQAGPHRLGVVVCDGVVVVDVADWRLWFGALPGDLPAGDGSG